MRTSYLVLMSLLGSTAAVFPPGPPSDEYNWEDEEEDRFYQDGSIGLDNVDQFYYDIDRQAIVPLQSGSEDSDLERPTPVSSLSNVFLWRIAHFICKILARDRNLATVLTSGH